MTDYIFVSAINPILAHRFHGEKNKCVQLSVVSQLNCQFVNSLQCFDKKKISSSTSNFLPAFSVGLVVFKSGLKLL